MKRLVFAVLIALLSLAACGGDETEDAAASTQTSTATPAPPQPTATAIVNPTLPPPATLQVGGTPLPTRTLAATITPAPTRTPNLNIPITPETAVPTAGSGEPSEAENTPTFTITYPELTRQLRSGEPPVSLDTIAEDSLQVVYEDDAPHLRFGLILAGEQEVNIVSTPLFFAFTPEEGFVQVQLGNVTYDERPNEIYSGELVNELNLRVQNALNTLIIEKNAEEAGVGAAFAVVEFEADASGLVIKTVVQE